MKFSTTLLLLSMANLAFGQERVGAPKMSLSGDRGGQGRFAKNSDAALQRQRRRAREVEEERRLLSHPRGL